MWSGGITSWATARIIVERHGPDAVTFLFADTNAEDEDLYRFNEEAAAKLGGQVVRVADPRERDPWDVFEDERYLGNTRLAPCSKLLKQAPARRWVADNTTPEDATLYIGIDWTETHRIPANRAGWAPWPVEYPLTEPPYRDKDFWIEEARRAGLEPTRMYDLGFSHANCGGACVRAGQGQWAHLLKVFPERYAYAEAREERLRQKLGKDVSILRDRRGGTLKPLTLKAFRERIEAQEADVDADDIGGCGCFTEAA
ncbi:hypothetical protein HCJ93_08265 [Streptomyces sp. SBST2-5]|uniref:Phosphoadenosine phosphosulphate reductase domain-containing protein n=2 Tax=Streptomyces composti TaxID=2720025 RepID=A0ABX1A1G0_9ACTN|nr:hypothetical protein [Streptomyces composti]